MRTHIQVELPEDPEEVNKIIGQCKVAASHAIRSELPGRVWARGGSFKPINDEQHHGNVFRYILNQEDAWTWSYKDAPPEEDDEDASPRRLEDSPAGLGAEDTETDASPRRLEDSPAGLEEQDQNP